MKQRSRRQKASRPDRSYRRLKLASLMIHYNTGCRDEEVLYWKKIDEDFFDPE